MRFSPVVAAATLAFTARAASLSSMCTVSNIQAVLPANGTIAGIELDLSSVEASVVTNSSSSSNNHLKRETSSSSTTYDYCNVTATYKHAGRDDTIKVWYGFPDPAIFENRFFVMGGGGYSLPSGVTYGLQYGAVTGCTDAGYDAFSNSLDTVVLYANGSLNWDNIAMFSHKALGEMTTIGKEITKNLYSSDKVYTYFGGCSDGGRQAMSQVQKWGDVYDGIVAGAPAFRQSHQQVNHLYSAVVEVVQDYFPPPCALEKIVNRTIDACDSLDGRTDGVISRTDLCQLNFNLSSIVGESYYCAAENKTSLGFGFSKRAQTTGSTTSYIPAQNGTVSGKDVKVAQTIYDGLFNSAGQRAYLSWQIGSELSDASTSYDSDTASWTYSIESTGGVFVTKFLEEVDLDNLSTLTNVTYDTLVSWMDDALIKFSSTLETNLPDISKFQSSGGKLLHYHGESDPSIPAASSVHYYDSVREVMYPNQTYNASVQALSSWYKFFMVPGAAHCGTNSLQPGPYPVDLIQTMIDWVENGDVPNRLNSSVSSGDYEGETQMLCEWPTRPYWNTDSSFECVYDQASIDSWTYKFPAFKMPVY